ncbi:MAG TPA: S8 family serine peptidase [Blastocatellia bacterium]|jgi:subtilisin family serine protease
MAKTKASKIGAEGRKLQPKLRMVANGSTTVNAIRAEQSGSVAINNRKILKETATVRGNLAAPVTRSELPKSAKKGRLRELSKDVLASVFIETLDSGDKAKKLRGESARKANLVTATLSMSDLKKIAEDENVTYIEMGEPLASPTPVISAHNPRAPSASLRRIESAQKHRGGAGVLIGIIDVQGFDFAHPDFLDREGKTRFVRIWDQGGHARPSPNAQDPDHYDEEFNYGAEFRQEHLNRAIASSTKIGVPPQDIERQSQMNERSHGTHVASIAAGNRGVCPNAYIAGVLISLTSDDVARRSSFYDSTRVAHAVDYLFKLADELSEKEKRPVPVSLNISLGTNGHAHDASSAISRWIEAALAVPGRSVSVAAGNAGQEVAAFEGDLGFILGRIHTSGRVPARDLNTDIEWVIVGNGIADLSENELEVWYSPQDRFAVSIRPPGMGWIGPISPREFIENMQLKDGSFVSVYNELYHPANGSNYISIYLSPFFTAQGAVGIRAGQWLVRLHGIEVRDGSYHGWIERDDPRELGRIGDRRAWRFPSFFSDRSNIDNSSVSSLACGQRIISVANLDDAAERINITSSQGPTRDGRFKPDVAAPGTNIVAAKGFAGADDLWVSMSGTSMASPYVAGVVGLMFAVEPRLTAAQVEGIVQRTARPLPGGTFNWANDAGYGRISPAACLEEASLINIRKDLKK